MDPTSRRDPWTELSAGTHLSPRDGACLMEVVSRSAGQAWSDAPTCTHPLLGHLARLVNDASSSPARQTLLDYVPALLTARSQDPRAYPRLALACTAHAMRCRPTLWLASLHRTAVHQLRWEESRPVERIGAMAAGRRRLFQRGPAARAVEAAVIALAELPAPDRDAELRRLLEIGLHTVTPGRAATPGSIAGK